MKVTVKEFASGLRLIIVEMTGFYSASVGVMVKSGSRYEQAANNGYSHFIEHLSFKGTSRRTALDISHEIDDAGGDINAFTSKDVTCFHTKSAGEYVEKCFDLLSDMYFDSKMAQKDLSVERKVILEEIDADLDTPDEVCQDLLAQALYGDEGLGLRVLGTKTSVSKATREAILEYKKSRYTSFNTVLSVAGNVRADEIIALADKYFESRFAQSNDRSAEEKGEQKKQKVFSNFLHSVKDTEQCHLAYAYPSYCRTDERFAPFILANSAFGSGMSSRLFQAVREKQGLAYSVYSFSSSYSDCGYFEIYCGTNAKKLAAAKSLILQLTADFAKFGMTKQELERGKKLLAGGLKMSQESTMSVMRTYGARLLRYDEVYDVNKTLTAIDKVTLQQANDAFNDVVGNKCATAYVGSKEGLEILDNKLH